MRRFVETVSALAIAVCAGACATGPADPTPDLVSTAAGAVIISDRPEDWDPWSDPWGDPITNPSGLPWGDPAGNPWSDPLPSLLLCETPFSCAACLAACHIWADDARDRCDRENDDPNARLNCKLDVGNYEMACGMVCI